MDELKLKEQELIKELADVQKQIKLGKDVKQKIYRIEDAFSNNGLRGMIRMVNTISQVSMWK